MSSPGSTAAAERFGAPWFSDHRNLATVYAWMVEQGTAPDAVDFMEKPWKWQPEWRAYCDERREIEREAMA